MGQHNLPRSIITPHPQPQEPDEDQITQQIKANMAAQKQMLTILHESDDVIAIEAKIAAKRIAAMQKEGLTREEAVKIISKLG